MGTGLKSIKGIITLVTVITLGITSLSGCSGSVNPDDKIEKTDIKEDDTIKIGLTLDSFVNERWLKDRDVFTSSAEDLGAEVNVQNANGSVAEQQKQIEKFIENGMDVIMVVAVDSQSLAESVRDAHDHGIPVIAYDRLLLKSDADLYVSFDNEEVGALMADTIIEALPQGGRIVKINGPSKDNNVKLVNDGFDRRIEGHDIQVVGSYTANEWKGEEAFDYLTSNEKELGNPDAIMCGNDSLAGQAIRYLSERRMAGSVTVVGQDADLDACQRIVEGTQEMTVYKPIESLASKAAECAVKLAKKEKIDTDRAINDGFTDVPFVCVDIVPVKKDNMDKVIIDSGFHMRSEVYLNVGDTEEDKAS